MEAQAVLLPLRDNLAGSEVRFPSDRDGHAGILSWLTIATQSLILDCT